LWADAGERFAGESSGVCHSQVLGSIPKSQSTGAAATIVQSILPLLRLPIRAVGDLCRKLEAVSVSATSWSRVRLENGVNDVQSIGTR
jgi:hypothetical protein